jgi:ABC-type molybdate transport system permease subunit
MKTRRWQDWGTLVLGAWLFFSPLWMSAYDSTTDIAAWNSYIFGAAVFVLSWAALAQGERWEEWVNMLLGVWLVISPFVLGFYRGQGEAWNHFIVGMLVGGETLVVLSQVPGGQTPAMGGR